MDLDVFAGVRDTVGVHLDADGELVSANGHGQSEFLKILVATAWFAAMYDMFNEF